MSVLDTLEICFQANLNGVDGQLNGLIAQLGGLSGAAAEAERGVARSGQNMMSALAASIRSGGTRAVSAARMVAQSIRFDGGASGAASAGRGLALGFAAGIRGGQGAVGAAAASLTSAALKRLRSALAIHSPSKVTRGLGANFGAGFAQGIGGAMDQAARAADALGGAAASSLRNAAPPVLGKGGGLRDQMASAVQGALGGVNLTIPLNVDGIKLGEASIRGINAVTKSAGRVLINI